uniref:Helix-turn-helix domain protein n=1 Tax=Myoviridae sp. ct6eX13 TaxID=2827660 RepID=A0A8S5T4Z5_9CAUD|nr:MAG TPA: helix-turn-helix domain protein [Myoviridae sp. ct6eX13]
MDKEIFVQNIKIYCALKGVKPTVACRESGVGTSFISDINRGQIPSVAKVQQLAQYLGCTVSDLLGETKAADQPAGSQDMFMELYKSLPPDRQLKAYLELLNLRGKE